MRSHHQTNRFRFERLEHRRLLSFSVGGDYAISGYTNSVAVADFNNDARADFAVSTGSPDGICVMLGNANGTFAGAQVSSSQAGSLDAGDVNGDGKLDLVATNSSSHVQYFAGNGNGTFQPRQGVNLPPPPNPPSTYINIYYGLVVTVADVNADGKADMVVPCQYEYIDPSWDPESPYPPQIFYGNYLSVLRGNGNGTFSTAFVRDNTGASEIETWDLNGDGKLDLLLGFSGQLSVFLGAGNSTFSPGASYYWAMEPGDASLALADFNSDGRIDVAAAGQYVKVGLGDGRGGFAAPVSWSPGPSHARSLAAADFNGDGRPDLVAGNYGPYVAPTMVDGKVSVLLNDGAGGFRSPVVFPCGPSDSYAWAVAAAADFNGDGRPDVAATSYYQRPSPDPSLANVRLLINDGNWPVKTWIGLASGGNWSTAANWNPAGVPTANDHVLIAAATVNLTGNAVVGGLSLTGGAKLDLKDDDLVINYSGVSPIGSWNGSTYTGITGMIAAGDLFTSLSDAGPGMRTLGVSNDADGVIVKYTYAGDLDLDGDVDGDDYFAIDSHVAQSGIVFGYSVGDIDLDGDIDGDDYFWIDGNVMSQGEPL